MPNNRREVVRRYMERRYERGTCMTCTRPRLPDRVSCQWCLDKAIERRARLEAQGKCVLCGAREPKPGRRRCAVCTKAQSRSADEKRTLALAKGLCEYCKKNPHEDGRRKCRDCADRVNARQRQRRTGSPAVLEYAQMNVRGPYNVKPRPKTWSTDRADALVLMREKETRVRRGLVDRELVARIDRAIKYLNARGKREKGKS